LYNVAIEGVTSIGGAGLLRVGAANTLGMIKCRLNNIFYEDATGWGIELHNFMQCEFGNMTGRNAIKGGGIRYGCQLGSRVAPGNAVLIPGNSTWWGTSFIFNSHVSGRGYEWYARTTTDANQLNELHAQGAKFQVNRFIGSSVPPRFGKSETIAYLFVAWYLGHNPDHYVIMVTHTANLSASFGRKVRDLIESPVYQEIFPGTRVSKDKTASDDWVTSKGGRYLAIGVGGSVAGYGAHLLIADDLVSEQAVLANPARCRNLESTPDPVGKSTQDRSPDGVYDLGGNVTEWVADAFLEHYEPCQGACKEPQISDESIASAGKKKNKK
jgi:hypothetical protein